MKCLCRKTADTTLSVFNNRSVFLSGNAAVTVRMEPIRFVGNHTKRPITIYDYRPFINQFFECFRVRFPAVQDCFSLKRLSALYDCRAAHAAADTQGRKSFLAVPLLHLIQQGYEDPRTGTADRMA